MIHKEIRGKVATLNAITATNGYVNEFNSKLFRSILKDLNTEYGTLESQKSDNQNKTLSNYIEEIQKAYGNSNAGNIYPTKWMRDTIETICENF